MTNPTVNQTIPSVRNMEYAVLDNFTRYFLIFIIPYMLAGSNSALRRREWYTVWSGSKDSAER